MAPIPNPGPDENRKPLPLPGDPDHKGSPPIRMAWLALILALLIAVTMGLILLGFSKDNVFGPLNEPPRIAYFFPMYGTIGPFGDDDIKVIAGDDHDFSNDLRYKWEVSEGTFEQTEDSSVIVYHAPSAPGSYYVFVTVTVTDRQGASTTATTRILVSDQGY